MTRTRPSQSEYSSYGWNPHHEVHQDDKNLGYPPVRIFRQSFTSVRQFVSHIPFGPDSLCKKHSSATTGTAADPNTESSSLALQEGGEKEPLLFDDESGPSRYAIVGNCARWGTGTSQ
jgi:hypothetical protein